MKPNLRRTHDLGEIVGYAYRVYLACFSVMFALALVTVPLRMLIGVIQDRVGADGAQVVQVVTLIPEALINVVATAAVVHAWHEYSGGTRPQFGTSLDAAIERLGALLGTALLAGYRTLLSVLAVPFLAIYWLFRRDATIDGQRNWWFAVVPFALTVYLAVRWVFVAQTVMIDGKRGWPALDESARLVRGEWWRSLGILLVVALIQLGPVLVGTTASLLPALIGATIAALIFALVLPFYAGAQTLLYYDLKTKKEAYAGPEGVAAAEQDGPGQGT